LCCRQIFKNQTQLYLRNVTLYIAASLDSFIARQDGKVDWLDYPEYQLPDEDYGYTEFYQTIDTTLMGNKTYEIMLGFNVPFPYPDKTNFVFTRSIDKQNNEFVKFVTGDIIKFVRQLKNKPGKGIWLIGGGQINSLLLDNDLVDQIILTVIPITIGQGIPLFNANSKETKFVLAGNTSYDSGLVQLTYKKKN
jgi:dihydrofolate reductase